MFSQACVCSHGVGTSGTRSLLEEGGYVKVGWVCAGGDVLGWYSPPPVLTSSGATEAGGMHHTGMHSCILRI